MRRRWREKQTERVGERGRERVRDRERKRDSNFAMLHYEYESDLTY